MFYFTEVTNVLSALNLLSHILIGLVILFAITKKAGGKVAAGDRLFAWISKNVLLLSFIVALVAVGGSLYYSDIAALPPCKLCWFQRIFIYPQLFLFALALKKKDEGIVDYAIMLALIGVGIAGYHYGIQINDTLKAVADTLTPCSIVGMTPSCSKYFFLKFGYITIPLMSLTTSALILMFGLVHKYENRSPVKDMVKKWFSR